MADLSETDQTDSAVRVRLGPTSANDNAAKGRGDDARPTNDGGPGEEGGPRPGQRSCGVPASSPEALALARANLAWLSFGAGVVGSEAASPRNVAGEGENAGASSARNGGRPSPPRRRRPEGRRGFPSARGRTPQGGKRAPQV